MQEPSFPSADRGLAARHLPEFYRQKRGDILKTELITSAIVAASLLAANVSHADIAGADGSEHAQALAAIDEQSEALAPRYVLAAVFHSALTLPDEARAERLHSVLAKRFGADAENDIKLCQLELQLGHHEKALTLSAQLVERFPRRLDVLDLRAYTLCQAGRPGEALLVYQEMQRLFPENNEAKKATGMQLADLGSPRLSNVTNWTLTPFRRTRS